MRNVLITKDKKIAGPSEFTEQKRLITLLKYEFPKLLYCASAGGMRTGMHTAKKMKATGYVKGFPDIFIYEPRGKYHGLAIELKRESGGTISPEQKLWRDNLKSRGYAAYICRGADEAIETIKQYMNEGND